MRALIPLSVSGAILICAAAPSAAQNFEIKEFTAHPQVLAQGQSSTLRWRVSGQPREIMIVRDREWPPLKYVDRIGEMSVSPVKTTRYTLYLKDGTERKTQSITIQYRPIKVRPTIGYCTVFGHVGRDRPAYRTKAYLINTLTRATIGPIQVDPAGDYRLSNVAPGNYTVTLRADFPSSDDYREAIGPVPPQRRISCVPGGRHQADFKIGSNEG